MAIITNWLYLMGFISVNKKVQLLCSLESIYLAHWLKKKYLFWLWNRATTGPHYSVWSLKWILSYSRFTCAPDPNEILNPPSSLPLRNQSRLLQRCTWNLKIWEIPNQGVALPSCRQRQVQISSLNFAPDLNQHVISLSFFSEWNPVILFQTWLIQI